MAEKDPPSSPNPLSAAIGSVIHSGASASGQPRSNPLGAVLTQTTAWTGPLPNPEALARFEEILPGSADRIIRMAEEEGAHQRSIQKQDLLVSARIQFTGMAVGGVLCLLSLVLGYMLGSNGHTVAAGAMLGIPVASIIVAMIRVGQFFRRRPG